MDPAIDHVDVMLIVDRMPLYYKVNLMTNDVIIIISVFDIIIAKASSSILPLMLSDVMELCMGI